MKPTNNTASKTVEETLYRLRRLRDNETRTDRVKAVKEAKKELDAYYLNEALKDIEKLEVDREATEKHIRSVMVGKTEEEIEHQLLAMQIDADDRKAVLDDVREQFKERFGGDI